MENESILDYVIHNDKICSVNEVNLIEELKKPSIYEVIRIIDGIPLYLEEHLERFRKSARLTGIKITKTDEEIVNKIYELIKINKEYNLNIKILFNNSLHGKGNIYFYFVKSLYPLKTMYKKGIHTIFYRTERENPNAKTANKELRELIARAREKEKAFEALLVNSKDQITEGSRSNIFFVKNGKLHTPPSEKVLLGVTRTKVVELSKLNNIDLIEKDILVDDITKYDGAFITGTSINVLPIKSIDKTILNSQNNDLVKHIMGIYEQDMKNYINTRKEL